MSRIEVESNTTKHLDKLGRAIQQLFALKDVPSHQALLAVLVCPQSESPIQRTTIPETHIERWEKQFCPGGAAVGLLVDLCPCAVPSTPPQAPAIAKGGGGQSDAVCVCPCVRVCACVWSFASRGTHGTKDAQHALPALRVLGANHNVDKIPAVRGLDEKLQQGLVVHALRAALPQLNPPLANWRMMSN